MAKPDTVGTRLWLSLYRADQCAKQAIVPEVPPDATKMNPQRATRKWLEGMSKHIRASFPEKLREARENLGVSQLELSQIAQLSVNGVAMIERGERAPSLDTAARLCWALDVASGVTREQLRLS